jgi:hypothetical protein
MAESGVGASWVMAVISRSGQLLPLAGWRRLTTARDARQPYVGFAQRVM